MAIALYDLSVATYLQTLGAVSGFLDKGLAHCKSAGIDPESIVASRLAPDMLPFRFQIESVAHHSAGAIEGIRKGVFAPPPEAPARDYAGLQQLIEQARASLQALSPAEVNALEGKPMVFELRGRQMPFVAENFVMSFSLPNFFFHSTTTYSLLRHAGVPLGKRDFMGQMRMRA